MFNPLAFASSATLEAADTVERCGCGCSGVVGVQVDDWVIVAF